MARLNKVTVRAYGKLNLMLDIVGKRKDGYHMLNTVMQSVSCYDLITAQLVEGSGIEIVCDRLDVPLDNSNLVWKAIEAFYEYSCIAPQGKIVVTIKKQLPSMAGMGGGSADCAAMLHLLNLMYDTQFEDNILCEIGVKLGADVPFCIVGGTQLCQGIGEKLSRLPTPDCLFVIVKPDTSVSTPEAFEKYDSISNPKRCSLDTFLKAIGSGNMYSMCTNMFNVLEYASENHEIGVAKSFLKSSGAMESAMTGSGSAVFGVFNDEKLAESAYGKTSEYNYRALCKPVKKGWEIVSIE